MNVVNAYFQATSELVSIGLANLKQDDPAGYEKLSLALKAGAPLALSTRVSLDGQAECVCRLELIDQYGETDGVELFRIEPIAKGTMQ